MQSLFYTYTSPHRLFHPAAKRNTLSESAHNPTFKVARTSCQCCSTCQAQNGLSVLAATVLPEGINVALCKWSTVIIRAFSVDCYLTLTFKLRGLLTRLPRSSLVKLQVNYVLTDSMLI